MKWRALRILKEWLENQKHIITSIVAGKNIWAIANSMATSAYMLSTNILSARLESSDRFGQFALFQSALVVYTTAISSSLGQVALILLPKSTNDDKVAHLLITQLNRILSYGILFSAVIIVNSIDYLEGIVDATYGVAMLTIYILIVLTSSGSYSLQQCILQGKGSVKEAAILSVARLTIGLISQVALISWHEVRPNGESPSMVAFVLTMCIVAALGHVILKPMGLITYQANGTFDTKVDLRIVGGLIAPSAICGIIFALGSWILTFKLSKQINGLELVAQFSAINQAARSTITFLPMAMLPVTLTTFSSMWQFGELNRRALVARSLIWNTAIAISVSTILLINRDRVAILYNISSPEFTSILLVSAVTAVLGVANLVANSLLISAGKMWMSVAAHALWIAVVAIFLAYTGQFTILNVALGLMTAQFAQFALTIFLMKRLLEQT